MNSEKRKKIIVRVQEIFAQAGTYNYLELTTEKGIPAKTGLWSYEELRSEELGFQGFASYYLCHSRDFNRLQQTSNEPNMANVSIYKELYYIDKAFGTTASEQLIEVVRHTFREDIFKVKFGLLFL